MGNKSMRDRMFESAAHDMARDADNTLSQLSQLASTPPVMFAQVRKPMMPYSHCYLCGIKEDIMEIEFGQLPSGHTNIINICPTCKTWFGNFLTSDAKKIMQRIPEKEQNNGES